MEEFLKIVKTSGDSRDYYDILEDHPEFVNMQDAEGKTALMYAAMKGYGDSMATLVETHKADVTLKDKSGRSAYDYAREWYAENPEEYDNDESVPEYFLGILTSAAAKQAKDVTALARTSKSGLPLPEGPAGIVGSYLTGKKGTVGQQTTAIKSSVGRGKTRKGKKSKKSRKGKKSRTSRRV
jgi:hypothetical protein